MKRMWLILVFILCMVSNARADWKDTFDTTYSDKGLDTAVMRVLSKGVSTTDIFEYAFIDLHIAATPIFVAMYCSGIKSPEITRLTRLFFVPLSRTIKAYKKSTVKCRLGTA